MSFPNTWGSLREGGEVKAICPWMCCLLGGAKQFWAGRGEASGGILWRGWWLVLGGEGGGLQVGVWAGFVCIGKVTN